MGGLVVHHHLCDSGYRRDSMGVSTTIVDGLGEVDDTVCFANRLVMELGSTFGSV